MCTNCKCCTVNEEGTKSANIIGAEGSFCSMCVASVFSCSGRVYECTTCPDLKDERKDNI